MLLACFSRSLKDPFPPARIAALNAIAATQQYYTVQVAATQQYYTVVWSVEIFLVGQNRSSKQRSGMILEVQIQNFGTRVKVFIFQKIQGTQTFIFFCEKRFLFQNSKMPFFRGQPNFFS